MNIEEISPHLKFWEHAKSHQMSDRQSIEWMATSSEWRERICNVIVQKNFTNIYDAGCGVGIMATLLKDAGHNFNYKGIDITPKFVNICRKLGYDVSLGDLNNINEPDNKYDWVMAIDVLNHQLGFKKQLSELIRISSRVAYVSFFKEFKQPSEIVHKHKDPPLIYHHFDKQEIIHYLNTFDNIKFSFHHAGRMSRGVTPYTLWAVEKSPIPKESNIIFHEEKEKPPHLLPFEDLMIVKARRR